MSNARFVSQHGVSPQRPTIAIVGAGASGTLAAIQLLRAASRRMSGIDVVLLDPADNVGRGVAFGTTDDRHLLNVPASGMSAFPEDPGNFVSWRARQRDAKVGEPWEFAPRREYGRYLADTLAVVADAASDTASLGHRRAEVAALSRFGDGVEVAFVDGTMLAADAVVLAVGSPEIGTGWAPEALRRSPFFVDDPWRHGALDLVARDQLGPPDVLFVGSGLTMVDLALTLSESREGRRLQVISRHARLPQTHVSPPTLAAIPDISDWGHSLPELRRRAEDYVRSVEAATGDWRAGIDGLRHQVATLWDRLSDEERITFLREDAAAWGVRRHRMPPSSADTLERMAKDGMLTVDAAEVLDARPLREGGLAVTLSDGSTREVGWVVNCTGPGIDVRADGLLACLLEPVGPGALASLSTAGLGFRTRRGRLLDQAGTTTAPIWTLGALRRGELFESTAVPEIRAQAGQLATDVLDALVPLPRVLADGRVVSGHHPVARPRDMLGLPISTTAEAATAYNAGLEKIMRLESGSEDLIREAVEIDPGFAVGHAALAMLGHEAGAACDVQASLAAARAAVRIKGDARESSLVEVVGRRVEDARQGGAQALMGHIATYPRDVLAVSAAVPTIAFSGVTDIQREAWELVEGLAPAYGDHWWYVSLLAFTRQDQDRFEEAGLLAESALTCEPSSGHAVHALTHVMYETGQHEPGRAWLDNWVAESGRSSGHRAHFSWHAALHELALGDTEAVRGRYYSQLAPPAVSGVRALIDSASLLWRWRMTTSGWDGAGAAHGVPAAFGAEAAPPPVEPVLAVVDRGLLVTPATPFVAMHAAMSLAAAGDADGLGRLRSQCAGAVDATVQAVVVLACDGFLAMLEERWGDAVGHLRAAQPTLVKVGGSAAQRDVVEETLLFCLVNDGQVEQAVELLDARLDRRPSPLDRRRANALAAVSQPINHSLQR